MRVPPPRDVWCFYVDSGSAMPADDHPICLPSGFTVEQTALIHRALQRERARWLPVIPFALRRAANEAFRRD